MNTHDTHGHHCQNYIVTQTLYGHLSAFEKIGIKIPKESMIAEIEAELLQCLKHNFATAELSVNVEAIPFNVLCNEMISMAHKAKKSFPDALVISTAPLIAYEAGGACIELSRLINFNGEIIGRGTRPGRDSVSRQFNGVCEKAKGKPIVIIEDGSFTGESLEYLLDICNGRNIQIEAIVLGILFPQAEEVLKKKYNGEIIVYRKADKTLDWMPSHDFFPFIPNSGRPIGTFLGKTCFPVYLHNGASLSMPYIMPYGDPKNWASLQGDIIQLASFSRSCLWSSLRIFQKMEELNGKKIIIKDLMSSYPRTSMPVSLEQYDFLDQTERITDILNGDLQFLS